MAVDAARLRPAHTGGAAAAWGPLICLDQMANSYLHAAPTSKAPWFPCPMALQDYAAMLREAGFEGVAAFDRTEQVGWGLTFLLLPFLVLTLLFPLLGLTLPACCTQLLCRQPPSDGQPSAKAVCLFVCPAACTPPLRLRARRRAHLCMWCTACSVRGSTPQLFPPLQHKLDATPLQNWLSLPRTNNPVPSIAFHWLSAVQGLAGARAHGGGGGPRGIRGRLWAGGL